MLQRYDVTYDRCTECGFVQTENPYWLGEAYSDAITATDVGLVNRALENSAIASAVIECFASPGASFLDFAGGYGLFVRLMRNKGYDFWRQDKFCENIFARGWDVDGRSATSPLGNPFALVTAFEVFEHFADPHEGMLDVLRYGDEVLLSTELVPASVPRPGAWWYYGHEHGQHVSLYTVGALKALARSHALTLITTGGPYHLLTRRRISRAVFGLVTRVRIARVLSRARRRPSLQERDYQERLAWVNSDASGTPASES